MTAIFPVFWGFSGSTGEKVWRGRRVGTRSSNVQDARADLTAIRRPGKRRARRREVGPCHTGGSANSGQPSSRRKPSSLPRHCSEEIMGVGSVGSDNKPKVDPQPKPDSKPKDPNATDPGQRIRAPSDEYRAAAAPPPAPVKLDSAPQAAPAADAGGSHLFGLAPSGSQIAESAARISAFAQTVSIGQPIDNGGGAAAHAWDNVVVQDFSGGKDTEGKCLVADGPSGPQLVRNAFYGKYLEGINHVKLGAPLDKEHWDNGQVVQNFEHGRMTWTPQTGALVEVAGARHDAGQRVVGVYREVLGREAHPGGRTTWTHWVEAHRAEGQSDPEIRQGLVEKFKQSEEYRRTHGNNPEPPPVDPGGPVVGPTGINPAPAFRSLYQPYEVANGVKVPSRVGVHWGPETSYSNVGRINDVADRLKSQGVGFATVIVNSENVQGQAPTIKALLDRGIQPVVRLLPGNQYDKTMDHLSEDEMKSMADAAGQLRQMG